MDAIDLPHSDTGPRDALPIILIHGFPLDHSMWTPQKTALANAGFRVIVPDLRGHGKAPVGTGTATMAAHAADILRLADRVAIRKFAVAGFSMGGYVALELARQVPDRIAGVALVDTRAEPDTTEARKGRQDSAAKVRKLGPAPVVDTMLPKLLTGNADSSLRTQVERTMRNTSPEGMAQSLLGMGDRPDARPTMGRIRVPTVVIVGENDTITPPEAARVLATGIPNAKLVTIAGAAHLTTLEKPGAVTEAMMAWAKSISAL